MKKRTILFVPPRGVPLKSLRIRLSVAVVFVLVVLAGFAGLFIPINYTQDDVEQNQKKNLTEQNRALLQKILTTLRMLNNLKTQVARLEKKQGDVVTLAGQKVKRPADQHWKTDFSKFKSEDLLKYVDNQLARFQPFIPAIEDNGNVFENIPVLRPVPEPYIISRRFGIGKDPFSLKQLRHNGVDFVAEIGTPVLATAGGTVRRAEVHAIWGKRVYIDHGGGFSTIFAHLGETKVRAGKKVKRGEIIGTVGKSGLSSGPHVHYEVWRNGEAVDPEIYLFPLNFETAGQ